MNVITNYDTRYFVSLYRLFLFAILLSFSNNVLPDSFMKAKPRIVINQDNNIAVRIVPRTTGASNAIAEYYKLGLVGFKFERSITLHNPLSPVSAYVENSGNLVTVDDWGRSGHGTVIYVYSKNGKVIRKYELDDLIPMFTRWGFDRTSSVIQWTCESKIPFVENEMLKIVDAKGGLITINMKTGEHTYLKNKEKCD